MSGTRRALLSLALFAAPLALGATSSRHADAAPPPGQVNKAVKADPLAKHYGGQILFLDSAPPAKLSGEGWFGAHKISKKEENSKVDEKSPNEWKLHMMIFLKAPVYFPNPITVQVHKITKKGVKELVQTLEQRPSDDGQSFYFLITLKKLPPYEPNLKYEFVATAPGVTANGGIELNGKEEKIGGGDMDFTKGMDLSKPKEEKATEKWDSAAAVEALKKILYEDCKTATSPGGKARIIIKFAGKDGKALSAAFDGTAPYHETTQTCIIRKFEKAKTKPFTGEETHTAAWTVAL